MRVMGYGLAVLIGFAAPASAQVEAVQALAPAAAVDTQQDLVEKVNDPGNISLDFKEADINTVLRVLALKSKTNIVAGPEVQGTVTIRLENVPWEKALDVVLRTYDYVYEKDQNIIRVTTRGKMAQEAVVTQTFLLNYSKAAEIEAAIKDMLTERGRIKTAERTNSLVITDIPTNLFRVGEVIAKLDHVTPQAFVDSKIVKTDVGISENLGIAWNVQGGLSSGMSRPVTFPFSLSTNDQIEEISPYIERFFPVIVGTTGTPNTRDARGVLFPAGSVTEGSDAFTFGTLDFSDFSSILQMLKSRSNTKIVSNPRIVVLNNQTAKVQVGEEIPLPSFERNETTGSVEVTGFTFRDVGVVLYVTPHINSEEEILVDLKPEVSSERATNVDFGDFQIPAFTVTSASTQVMIQSGQTIAIGGLLTDNESMSESRVPFFSEVPVIGKLFRSKRQTAGAGNSKIETLFFVTVTLVDSSGQPTGRKASGRFKRNQDAKPATSSPETQATAA